MSNVSSLVTFQTSFTDIICTLRQWAKSREHPYIMTSEQCQRPLELRYFKR
jgi:hypothetical protein